MEVRTESMQNPITYRKKPRTRLWYDHNKLALHLSLLHLTQATHNAYPVQKTYPR
jgi:hypothetical protein